MNPKDIRNIESEAGVIASVLLRPDFTYYSEQLRPSHFSDRQNAYLYYAVCELAKRGIEQVDAYNITNILNAKESTKKAAEEFTVSGLNELLDLSRLIARSLVEEYQLLADNVFRSAMKRELFSKLSECQRLCFQDSENIEQKIYATLDDVLLDYSTAANIPQYKDQVDALWQEIQTRQTESGVAGIPFKFPTLNQYATIEAGELFLFAAEAKQGKSMILLNCAVDLLKKDLSVLYLDSELNSRMFTCRLLAHMAGIEFSRVKSGRYTEEEGGRINTCIRWLKKRKFTHLYMPMFDAQTIYAAVKKVKHTQGLDVLIVDYFKGKGDGDAFSSYQELGRLVDLVKNTICGDMNIAGLGAAQATSTGRVADSAKIGRNASTIAVIQDKTQEEMEADGRDCGNKKLRVVLNRNGMQHGPNEYIDMQFNGNLISYEEAPRQHIHEQPY